MADPSSNVVPMELLPEEGCQTDAGWLRCQRFLKENLENNVECLHKLLDYLESPYRVKERLIMSADVIEGWKDENQNLHRVPKQHVERLMMFCGCMVGPAHSVGTGLATSPGPGEETIFGNKPSFPQVIDTSRFEVYQSHSGVQPSNFIPLDLAKENLSPKAKYVKLVIRDMNFPFLALKAGMHCCVPGFFDGNSDAFPRLHCSPKFSGSWPALSDQVTPLMAGMVKNSNRLDSLDSGGIIGVPYSTTTSGSFQSTAGTAEVCVVHPMVHCPVVPDTASGGEDLNQVVNGYGPFNAVVAVPQNMIHAMCFFSGLVGNRCQFEDFFRLDGKLRELPEHIKAAIIMTWMELEIVKRSGVTEDVTGGFQKIYQHLRNDLFRIPPINIQELARQTRILYLAATGGRSSAAVVSGNARVAAAVHLSHHVWPEQGRDDILSPREVMEEIDFSLMSRPIPVHLLLPVEVGYLGDFRNAADAVFPDSFVQKCRLLSQQMSD